jgi:hypothetical protein
MNTYNITRISTDLSISSVRWENITTGASGYGNVTQGYECIFAWGCGTMTRYEYDISLATGKNTVYTYRKSGGCDWIEGIYEINYY